MYLKKYQQRVVSELKQFFTIAQSTRSSFELALKALPKDMQNSLNYVEKTFESLNIPYTDKCKNGLKKYYPRINLKVPTGGGKTILAVEAIKEYQSVFAQRKTGLVVWIVPKEIIRQLLDQASGGKIIIAEKGHKLTKQDIEENLVILFIMSQSVNRANNKEALKVFKDSGGFDSFFPADNRYDLHYQWKQEVPNLDVMWNNGEQAQLLTSLGNAVRVSKPFIIIDEFHKVFTPTAKATIDNLNPEMILGLSATPAKDKKNKNPLMNNISSVTGLELKEEEMIKLDLHIIPPNSSADNDWTAMLQNIIEKRQSLEEKAIEFKQETGQYIRPIALIQCERTGKDQRAKDFVHSEDVKEHLIEEGINPNEIAIKSSNKNDIENIDLFSRECPIRFIITRDALSEGWDCSFAYVLGIIPNVKSNTSITQLIGRILRQPRAKKTGITDLDESYVYYSKGATNELLKKVVKGFEEEGLGDLVTQMQVQNNTEVNPKKRVKIKDEFKKFEYAFYLPVWVMVNEAKESYRKFNYSIDIKQHISFENLNLSNDLITKVSNSLSEQNNTQKTFSVTIDDDSKIAALSETIDNAYQKKINIGYLSRRLGEFIENAFLARKKADQWIVELKDKIGEQDLAKHFNFIAAELSIYAGQYKHNEEEKLFATYLENHKIKLTITDNKAVGFRVPDADTITVSRFPSNFKYNLYEDVDFDNLTSLEKEVINILEKEETTLFSFRNRTSKGWYNIQGWRKNKIYPDFVVAKKKDENKLEILYLMESKGEHLLGNSDTIYKNEVFKKMTEQHQTGKIITHQVEIQFDKLNEEVEAYLIEGGKEQQQIRELMK